jgi:methylmalonyl-CoA/ethylmalonyl-CoA epimerase
MTIPRIDHIGIIVEDLEKSVNLFEGRLGLKLTGAKEMPDVGLKIAQIVSANVKIELIQYIDEANSFGKKVMGKQQGFNHISFEVKNIHRVLISFENKGLKVMAGFPRQGSQGMVAFFEPATTEGVLLELCEG